jgi:polar amino acid transport system substrate-binding protein
MALARETLAALLLAFVALTTTAAAQGTPELRWGGDAEGGAPFVEADPRNPTEVVGFEVDIAQLLAGELGRVPHFVQVGFTSLDAAAARGDFDVALSGVEDSPARRARLAVTVPYYEFRELLTVREVDAPRIRSLADLRGRRVATLGATLAADILQRAEAEHGLIPVIYEDDVHPYTDLAIGRVDAVLLDEVLANRGVRRNPGLVNVPAGSVGHYVGILSRSNIELRDRMNAILRQAMQDGRLEAIFRRWRMWNDDQPRLYTRVLAGSTAAGGALAPGEADGANALGVSSNGTASGAAPTTPDADASRDAESASVWEAAVAYLPALLNAAAITLVLSCLSMLLAVTIGLLIAAGRVYGPRWVQVALTAWVEIIRGTPLLLQLFVLYFGLATVIQLPAFIAALIGLGLNYAAYESEIYRSALEAVPSGQLDAARTLGFSNLQTLRLIRGPQALRLALAPMTNDFVALLKDSSLVSVITVVELTKQTSIFAANIGSWLLPGAMCATMYLMLSLPLARLARRIEKGWRLA